MVSLKLLCSSAADDEFVSAWLSVRGLQIARDATRSTGRPTGPRNRLGRPAWARFGPVHVLLRLVLLPTFSRSSPLLHVGPCRRFLSELDEAPCLARFSIRVCHLLGLGPWALGVMFTSLLDLYRASRSCHEVLNEFILEVFLSTLKPCVNT
jgi:hypothetical protein